MTCMCVCMCCAVYVLCVCIMCLCISVCACRVCVCVRAHMSVCMSCVCECVCTCIQWCVLCKCTMYVYEDQMETQCTYNGPILWEHNALQRTNPMWHDVHMYREPILWDSACSYTYLSVCTVSQVRAVCHCTKHQL